VRLKWRLKRKPRQASKNTLDPHAIEFTPLYLGSFGSVLELRCRLSYSIKNDSYSRIYSTRLGNTAVRNSRVGGGRAACRLDVLKTSICRGGLALEKPHYFFSQYCICVKAIATFCSEQLQKFSSEGAIHHSAAVRLTVANVA
jgi:hypothetical protein